MYRYLGKIAGVVLISLSSTYSDARDTGVDCAQFGRLLSTPPFLLGYSLEDIVDDRGVRRIPNVDVDGDGRIDVVNWECPNQGSPTPADPCTMSVEFASGKKLEFQEYGFSLVLYHAQMYALAASAGRARTVGGGKLWRVDESGVKLVCSAL